MNLKCPIELEVYWLGTEATQMKDLGIGVSLAPETRPITFYNVNLVSSGNIEYENRECGFIHSGGGEYATVLLYEDLKTLISRNT